LVALLFLLSVGFAAGECTVYKKSRYDRMIH